jgi:hypothetical protein
VGACRTIGAGLLLLAAAQGPAQAQETVRFAAGTSWINEDGSVLAIKEVASNGLMSGTFTTTAGCGARQPHPVTGWFAPAAKGGALAFSVTWQGCNSVTTWSSQFNGATGSFHALWHLAVASAPMWNGIISGAHTFVLQPAKKP